MCLLFMVERTPDDLHKCLLEKDAFSTFAWQEYSIEEQKDFCVLLAKLPQELQELVLLFAGSQDPHKEDDTLLVSIDTGELYIHLKEKNFVVTQSPAPCSYCLAFIYSSKPAQAIHKELSQYNDTIQNWTFGLIHGHEKKVFLLFE